MVATPRHANDDILVSWWLPGQSQAADFKPGKKKQVVDLFGPWRPMSTMAIPDLSGTTMPEPLISQGALLEVGFEFSENKELPFKVFDALRMKHSIDLTSLTHSLTKRGNVYRRFAMLRCGGDGE